VTIKASLYYKTLTAKVAEYNIKKAIYLADNKYFQDKNKEKMLF
jgi:hypothetical protein